MNCCHKDPLKSLLSPSRVYEFRMYDNLQLKGLLPFSVYWTIPAFFNRTQSTDREYFSSVSVGNARFQQ